MRTTVHIPDDLLKKVMYWSKAKTKTEAIRTALSEYARHEAVEALLAMAGTMPDFPDVIAMREEDLRLTLETHGPYGTRKFLETNDDETVESQAS